MRFSKLMENGICVHVVVDNLANNLVAVTSLSIPSTKPEFVARYRKEMGLLILQRNQDE